MEIRAIYLYSLLAYLKISTTKIPKYRTTEKVHWGEQGERNRLAYKGTKDKDSFELPHYSDNGNNVTEIICWYRF